MFACLASYSSLTPCSLLRCFSFGSSLSQNSQKDAKFTSVVHASTAYANCDLAKTEERVYEPCIKPSKLIEATTWMSDSMLDAITPQLLGKRPNTYTFAKALAESQLMEDAQGLPLIIVRPSIIGAIWKEPLPGWTDNVNGPTGMFVAVGKGVLTNMCGSVKSKADMIPVDIVSSCLIVAAAHRANLKSDEVPIIHCSSGQLNPLTWNHIPIYLEKFFFKYPYNCYRAPSTHFHASRKLFLLNYYLKHYYPAYAIDIGLRLMGKKPEFVKIYGKVWNMVETLHYFTTRGWHFESKNVMKLWNSLAEEDRKVYNFDIRQLDWDRYLFDYLMGVKIYILKEKLEDLPKARSNLSRLKQIGLYTNAAAWALFVRLFAWRRTRKQKWTVWSLGFMLTYIYQNYSFRPKVYLKSVEEYRKTALPAYA
ncbi:male sterility protein domain-containing protein [Ditylenchus destructor]|uniref:Fatty acyl-CoA reductase n=1 Tax=Ditylenchus destructor TaxID=166010 RepID=A0AAD4MST7_9BILA|nr:male sterility protein domain-containing protein [Ditylenchus destructor]